MGDLDEVIKQEINYILLNYWQNYCVACTLMVSRVWQERNVHETQESIEIQKNLVESTTMAGDINIVYSMIDLWYVWCTGMHGLWMSLGTSTIEVDWWFCYSWNIIYDIWCTGCFMCRWWDCDFQSIHIKKRDWKFILVRLENWMVRWTWIEWGKLQFIICVCREGGSWTGHSRRLLLGGA